MTSFELARTLWSEHSSSYPEAERALEVLSASEESMGPELVVRAPADWIDAVQADVDPARVAGLQRDNRKLHGQLLLYGLSRIDRRLGDVYRREGLDRSLRAVIRPDPETLFRAATPPASPDAKLISDNPADEDLLDREGFAWMLAGLFRQQRGQSAFGTGSIPVQIFGSWGSGKTTLAGFLRHSLEQGVDQTVAGRPGQPALAADKAMANGPWLVVPFDAWQHQRTAPPWWWLMDRVYREARRSCGASRDGHPALPLRRRVSVRWECWREARRSGGASSGDGHPVLPLGRRLSVWWWRWRWAVWASLTLAALAVVLTLVGSRLLDWIDRAQVILASFVALGATIVTLYAAYRSARSSLLVGSPRTAVALLRTGGDPFRRVADKYGDLITRIGRPVLVFIDNLDRCKPEYVVELLEGIQTIFGDVRVTYLVAADREWVARSFDVVYESFANVIGQPGRPLGYLFLEKTFAVSAQLPRLSEEARDRYWSAVLRGETRSRPEPVTPELRRRAVEEFAGKSADEAMSAVEGLGTAKASDRAKREAAAMVVIKRTMEGEQDHELRPYLPLMESNPRSLKRLRNAVSIARAGGVASGGSIAQGGELDGLIRWEILSLRWPALAVELSRRPSLAELLTQGGDASVALGEGLSPLANDDALRLVLTRPVDSGSPPDVPGWIRRQ